MKRFFLILLLCLTACDDTTYSETMTEDAKVTDMPFVPEGHGSGEGWSTDGHMVFTENKIPARYAVVFECQHGRFVVQGDDARHRALWQRLRVGMPVTITYRKVIIHGQATGLDFLDAKPAKP